MKEFVILMAAITSMVAFTIDAVLPALGLIAADLDVEMRNHVQYVISFVFAGLVLGFLIYGPISDTVGRRRTLFFGMGLFLVGTMIAWLADSLSIMLLGRFLQGLGAASPRTMTIAIVRDKFAGREMARVMSLIMSVFVIMPAFAPTIGQIIIHFGHWRMIFLFYMLYAVAVSVWAFFRLEESLPPENRRALQPRALWAGFKEAATHRLTLGYSIASGFIFAGLLGFIHSAEQIFHDLFMAEDRFALYFAVLAGSLGLAFLVNSKLVHRFGMRNITLTALIGASISALLYLVILSFTGAHLPGFLLCCGVIFFCIGMTFGNVSAMALEPMGHIAGMASSFMGATSMTVSLIGGGLIGQLYNGTLYPIAIGLLATNVIALILMFVIERGHLPHSNEHSG